MRRRTLFLFGAGASFGAGGMDNPPPLAKDLFCELVKSYPETWGALPLESRREFENQGFESGIEAIYGVYKPMSILLNRMGRYFAGFKIDRFDENLYHDLFKCFRPGFESGEFLMSTINYDCLIELAASQFFNCVTYYGRSRGLRVLKVHGSCNFFAQQIQVSPETTFIISTAKINAPLGVVPFDEVVSRLEQNQVPPAMSLFARGKKNIICGPIIEGIQAEFHDAIKTTERVVVVGVHPNLDDHQIWDHLGSTEAELILIGDEFACKKWIEGNRQSKRSQWLAGTFADGSGEMCRQLTI